jgi:hypothetical protein
MVRTLACVVPDCSGVVTIDDEAPPLPRSQWPVRCTGQDAHSLWLDSLPGGGYALAPRKAETQEIVFGDHARPKRT